MASKSIICAENISISCAIFEENIPSITQDINKTLWKNHKYSDFFPEFCQKWLFLRHKRQKLWKEK
jgi:hypothetical protein